MKVLLVLLLSLIVNVCNALEKENEVYNIEWSEVDTLTSSLAESCKSQPNKWKGILIISRGGLVSGGILAQKLNIKNIKVICLTSYNDDNKKGDFKVISMPSDIAENGKDWIVVDDLADSGNTLKYIKGLYPEAFYVTLLTKPQGKGLSVYAKEFPQDTWIVFPWER